MVLQQGAIVPKIRINHGLDERWLIGRNFRWKSLHLLVFRKDVPDVFCGRRHASLVKGGRLDEAVYFLHILVLI